MKEIVLSRGYVALVDDEDFEYLSQWKWSYFKAPRNRSGYATTRINGKVIKMHRLITNAPKGMDVDHKDHNGLNNTRINLSIVTRSQNNMNSQKRKDTSSKYKGVCWHNATNKWQVHITSNRKLKHLGLFNDELEAAKAYNTAALEYFGQNACLNII